jgi:soluble lytic murein transglycosylase-like protein
MRTSAPAAVACLAVLACGTPAAAELVYFESGRALSVKAVRSTGDAVILKLRSGGEVTLGRERIVRVEPDEVEYPDETEIPSVVQAAASASAAPSIPAKYRELVARTARKHGVDAGLVHAVIQVESGYEHRARSPKGARGLMQLLPSTGRQYGALDLFDPTVNVDAGVRHLKSLLGRFDLPIALAAYNAGEGAVARFGGIPPFRETRNYVSRILGLIQRK